MNTTQTHNMLGVLHCVYTWHINMASRCACVYEKDANITHTHAWWSFFFRLRSFCFRYNVHSVPGWMHMCIIIFFVDVMFYTKIIMNLNDEKAFAKRAPSRTGITYSRACMHAHANTSSQHTSEEGKRVGPKTLHMWKITKIMHTNILHLLARML